MQTETETCPVSSPDVANRLEQAIAHAAHLLPAQGPINVFVHHNTLHAFEEQGFHEAVASAATTFGCHPYLPEEDYRAELRAGRLTEKQIDEALLRETESGEELLAGGLTSRLRLRRAMLLSPQHVAPAAELNWLIAETDALRKYPVGQERAQVLEVLEATKRWALRSFPEERGNSAQASEPFARVAAWLRGTAPGGLLDWSESDWESATLRVLWGLCRQGVSGLPPRAVEFEGVRHRDFLYRWSGSDIDRPVNELLIRFCAAYVDQGFSQWELPGRTRGFYRCFLGLYARPGMSPGAVFDGLAGELQQLLDAGTTATAATLESLERLGVSEPEWDEYVSQTLLALRGWAGMLNQLEQRGDRVPLGVPPRSLAEYLAVRLVVERVVLRNVLAEQGQAGLALPELRRAAARSYSRNPNPSADELRRAFALFQLARANGWTPEQLFAIGPSAWAELVRELEAFDSIARRKIFQLAFEAAYREQVLGAYARHSQTVGLRQVAGRAAASERPSFQIVCCIDDREESFRRNLEEIDPACETFGAAGFFAVPIYYRGAGDAHFVPLCPIIMKPQHYVVERVSEGALEQHGRRKKARELLGQQAHAWHTRSRSFVGGMAMAVLGPLATLPLVARVLFPRLTAGMRRAAGEIVTPPKETELTLERQGGPPGKEPEQLGFTVNEMADAVERLLRDIGLTRNFAPIVVVCGHGSSSLNNPHESAYNCGACGGGRGGPNARAVSAMANDPRIRALLEKRGLRIPADTWFVGAFHNTCDDSVRFVDTERIPNEARPALEHVLSVVEVARPRNAHERSRRFVSAELSLSANKALRHVETRAEDLSQTRPEYNHATNAVCTVGRRARTRGLFLDRRSFLVSYDPDQDDAEQSILARILGAVIPVCGGINLEYYFSRVDVAGYGCGSKLPHNVTSLIGVMDGAASDLRTGLSAQMVEIHDPVRLLFVIETRPEHFLGIMQRNPTIRRLCGNGWVQVATLSPDSDEIQLLRGETFEPFCGPLEELPRVNQSVEWYRGWRDNLGFAQVLAGFQPEVKLSSGPSVGRG
ncbi:MAG: DUF2309 domain-containing protein [Planctomycetota bacterium]|jgi:uncharacterized protein YbcC (UPF0753/DUF2309 family)